MTAPTPGQVHQSDNRPTPIDENQLRTALAAATVPVVLLLRRLLPALPPAPSPAQWRAFVNAVFLLIMAGRRQARAATVSHYQWTILATAAALHDAKLASHVPPGVPDVGWLPAGDVPNVGPLLYDLNATEKLLDRVVRDRLGTEERQAVLNIAVGGAARHIRMAERNTIMQLVDADARATGWVRILDPAKRNCAFCITLASRGPVYKTQATALAGWHDNCGCTARQVFDSEFWPGKKQSTDWAKSIYDDGASYGGGRPDIRKLRRYLDDNPHVVAPEATPRPAVAS